MRRLQWQLMRIVDRLGVPGALSLVLLLAIVLGFLLLQWPAQQRLQQLRADTERSRAMMPAAPATAHDFLEVLPRQEGLLPQVQAIFDTAEGYGLVLDEVAYRKERRQDERLQRYHVDFALDASYPDIRAFIADVLAGVPSAALTQLSLERQDVRDAAVHARLRLTLFMVRP